MKTVRTIADLRLAVAAWRQEQKSLALVPTMGGLHEGHLSLVRLAGERSDKVIATLFVNPSQFAPTEDFGAYPRNEDTDRDMFADAGAGLLFAPSVDEIYPDGHATKVHVEGLSEVLEGEFRPHFFTGVASVVSKLLIQAMPDVAIFGEKDFQQLLIIRRMARDLDIPTEILGAPTIREADGLAMSSRNRYLNSDQRECAAALYASITKVAGLAAAGGDVDAACQAAMAHLLTLGFEGVEYLSVRDAETLAPYVDTSRPGRVLGAAWLGKARLIDNVPV